MATVDLEKFRADLYAVLAEVSSVPVERIDGAVRLNEDLNLDSLKRIEALSHMSDKYEFDPDIDAILELRTVDDIVRLMEEHLRGGGRESG